MDNTNPTREDRLKYIAAAKANKFKVNGYFFRSRLDESIKRNSLREGKENIPEIGIRGTFKKLEIPTYDEGFDELFEVIIENNRFIISQCEQSNKP